MPRILVPPVSAPQTPHGRRQRRRLENADRLLAAARQLFAQQGFAATTVEAITEAADLGKGTFFNHFPSKEHVFLALVEKQVGKLAAAAQGYDPQASIREQVRRVAHQIAAEWRHSQWLLRTMFATLLGSAELTAALQSLLTRGRGHMVALMREGQRRGELRRDISAADLIRTVQQVMLGTQLIWSLQPPERGRLPDLLARIDQALDLLWAGLQSGAASRSRGTRGRRR